MNCTERRLIDGETKRTIQCKINLCCFQNSSPLPKLSGPGHTADGSRSSAFEDDKQNESHRGRCRRCCHRTTRHDTHSLEGPMQSSWQKAPQPLHMIMAFRRQ